MVSLGSQCKMLKKQGIYQMQSGKSTLATPNTAPNTCQYCLRLFPFHELEEHEINCMLNPESILGSVKQKFINESTSSNPELAYHLRRFKIQDELEELKERKRKATSVVFLGPAQSGKTAITHHLVTEKYTFIDHTGNVAITENIIREVSFSDFVVFVFDGSNDIIVGDDMAAKLAHTLDIKPIACCLNKMDLNPNPEKAYLMLKQQVLNYLLRFGFDVAHVECVPTSALRAGENISKKSEKFWWYKGSTVVEAIGRMDQFSKQSKPLRVVVHEVLADGLVSGRIHSGTLVAGQEVLINPGAWSTNVEEITVNAKIMKETYPGEIVTLKLKGHVNFSVVKTGAIICTSIQPIGVVEALKARLCSLAEELIPGVSYHISCCHKTEFSSFIPEIHNKLDPKTYEVLVEQPLSLQYDDVGVVKLLVCYGGDPVSVEKFTEYPSLGRIMLLDPFKSRRLVAFGVVTSVLKRSPNPSPPPEGPEPMVEPVTGSSSKGKEVLETSDESAMKEQDGEVGSSSTKRRPKKKKKKNKKKKGGRH